MKPKISAFSGRVTLFAVLNISCASSICSRCNQSTNMSIYFGFQQTIQLKRSRMLTVRDKPFLVLAAALGCGVVCIRICVTVWAGLTVCTATGVVSTEVITVGVVVGVTVVDVVVVGVVAAKQTIISHNQFFCSSYRVAETQMKIQDNIFKLHNIIIVSSSKTFGSTTPLEDLCVGKVLCRVNCV